MAPAHLDRLSNDVNDRKTGVTFPGYVNYKKGCLPMLTYAASWGHESPIPRRIRYARAMTSIMPSTRFADGFFVSSHDRIIG